MKKLIAAFNSLPKEVKLLIAMAGLSTPLGIIFLMQRYVFKGASSFVIMLGLAAVIGVVALIGFLVPKLFGRSARKRTRRMEADLASGAESGPVSMDLRAAVKSNNEKFFTAIKDMRKLGISVYDLPWYVVIGDSGCGKTKLINEGGLTFSTGKPEGYQLGTLNYNWWFTEDAIFIDMAGRLCNPKDDSDYREWEAFLRTVGTGRRGFPINGVLLCVSAEHLLQESPEQHEADANTMLERLRDVQSKLGVTFATYLVITKCDKIVGFMQYFDRAERDITIKNQIFGWSRPGNFTELRDPELFSTDFDGLYGRLNELRLRRLNDEVDEFELGLAYSFPEEFRQLKEPLQTYVRTLFPAIKNPRAVKNLIFRGVYFTSATQQGGLILKHLAERLGSDAASQFPPLESMYPRPRPHFVKDLLFRKVFPEQGLVFRNEQEVVRNRQLARSLTVGTIVLSVLLIATLIISSLKFGRLISEPRGRALQTVNPEVVAKPAESLTLVSELGQDAQLLQASVWPRVLSLGIGADKPVECLTRIQMRLFEHAVLRRMLIAADLWLRSAKISGGPTDVEGGVPFEQYRTAFEQYLVWYNCSDEKSLPAAIDYDSFEKITGVIPASAPLAEQRKEILDGARRYFTAIRAARGWGNPAACLRGRDFDAPTTIRVALGNLYQYLERFATLGDKHPHPVIREWSRIRERCMQIQSTYDALLSTVDRPVETQEQLDGFRQVFNENYAVFAQAIDECTWKGEKSGAIIRIPALRAALREQREAWLGYQKQLVEALAKCHAPAADDPLVLAIKALVEGDERELRGLDRLLADNLKAAGLCDRDYYPGYFGADFEQIVREVPESFDHILVLTRGSDASRDDRLDFTDSLRGTVRPVVDRIHERMTTLEAAGDTGTATTQAWVAALQRLLYPEKADADAAANFASLPTRWQPPKLERLNNTYQDLIRKGTGTVLLRAIETRLQATEPWTLAELTPDWRETQHSAFVIPVPGVAEAPATPKETAEPPAVTKPPPGPPPLAQPTKPPSPAAPAPVPAAPPPATPERTAGAGLIPNCASPDFLNARAMECVQLLRFLSDFGPRFYFARASDPAPLNERCAALLNAAWQRYCESYVSAWNAAYAGAKLATLERVGRGDQRWEPFATQFRAGETARSSDALANVRDEFQPALAEILHATHWATFAPDTGWWLTQKDEFYSAQKAKVAAAFDAALRDRWTQGTFAVETTGLRSTAASNARPWEALAAEVAARWSDWCTAVGTDAKLPRRFETGDPSARLVAIPWDGITTLRTEVNLREERITQQLVDFQKLAQGLLNSELTSVFATVQADALGEQTTYGGWPYINEQGTGLTALETVGFEQFTKFLTLVQRADSALTPLEQGLPDDDVRRVRRAFVHSCEEWRTFLGLSAQGGTTPLEITVWTEDPLGEPLGQERMDDTAQHYYRTVRLAIGLRLQQAGEAVSGKPLEIQTTERGQARGVRAVWEWSRPPDQQELTFDLVDGIQPENQNFHFPVIKPRILGKPSPLAFCAYLHRYGRYADGNWVVSHGMDLEEKFKEAGHSELVAQLPGDKRIIGEKFIFKLPSGRNLPEPIARLEATKR